MVNGQSARSTISRTAASLIRMRRRLLRSPCRHRSMEQNHSARLRDAVPGRSARFCESPDSLRSSLREENGGLSRSRRAGRNPYDQHVRARTRANSPPTACYRKAAWRALRPLFVNRPFTVCGEPGADGRNVKLWVVNDRTSLRYPRRQRSHRRQPISLNR